MYKIEITYFKTGESSTIEIPKTSDVSFYMEQYQRNREALKWEIIKE